MPFSFHALQEVRQPKRALILAEPVTAGYGARYGR